MTEIKINTNGRHVLNRYLNASAQTFARFMNADYNAVLPRAVIKRATLVHRKGGFTKPGTKDYSANYRHGQPWLWRDYIPGNSRVSNEASADGKTMKRVPWFLVTIPDPGRYNHEIPSARAGLKDFGKGWVKKMEMGGQRKKTLSEMTYLFNKINSNLATLGKRK